jgi:hypothetical protein
MRGFIINVLLAKYYYDVLIKGGEMGGVCSTHGREEKGIRSSGRIKLKEGFENHGQLIQGVH